MLCFFVPTLGIIIVVVVDNVVVIIVVEMLTISVVLISGCRIGV